jgi:hypothetical protein
MPEKDIRRNEEEEEEEEFAIGLVVLYVVQSMSEYLCVHV